MGEALWLMFEEDARVMQMRQVEKAAPALSGLSVVLCRMCWVWTL